MFDCICNCLPEGTLYGLVDNGVLIAGAYLGLELDGWLAEKIGKYARPGLGAIIGGAIGNLVSDVLGAVTDPAILPMVGGIALGCILPMTLIPVIERAITRNGESK
jgi:hypothetical protein